MSATPPPDPLPFIPKTILGIPTPFVMMGVGLGSNIIKNKNVNTIGNLMLYGGAGLFIIRDVIPFFTKGTTTPPPTTCPTGQHLANGVCVDDTNPPVVCPTGQHNVNGVCVPDTPPPVICPAGQHPVNNVCVPDVPIPPDDGGGPNPTGTVVTSLAGLVAAVAAAATGDTVVLQDGTYDNPSRIGLSGRSGVIIAAGKRGSTMIRGAPIDLMSPGLTMTGFNLAYNAPGDYVFLRGNNCRFTRNFCHFANVGGDVAVQEWLTCYGNNCLVDHNEFTGKTNHGTYTLIGTGTALYTGCRILSNYYHDRALLSTPAEAIRIGSSQAAWLNFSAEVAYNRFEKIDGETELCTFKGSTINCHHNTAINCNSAFTFRHGNDNLFNDNILINSGFRAYGHGHQILRNQIIEDTHNALRGHICLGGGTDLDDAGAPGVAGPSNERHSQVRGCVIEQNLIMAGAATTLAIFALGEGTAPYMPVSNSIRNNIITGSRGVLTRQAAGALWGNNTVQGNLLFATGTAIIGDMPQSGFVHQDPNVQRLPDGTFAFLATSPLKWNQSVRFLYTSDVGINAP